MVLPPRKPVTVPPAAILPRLASQPSVPPVYRPGNTPAKPAEAVQMVRRGSGPRGFRVTFSANLNRVTGVSRRNVRRSGTNLGGGRQGSHRTAHRVLEAVIRHNLLGQNIGGARGNLNRVLTRLGTLRAVRNLTGRHRQNLQNVTTSVGNIANVGNLESTANDLLTFFNLLPGGASSSGSLVGHGEAGNAAVLDEYEDRLRNGTNQRYSKAQVAQSAWALLDYAPGANVDEADAAEVVYRHLVWLRNGWPRTVYACRAQTRDYLRNNKATVFAQNLANPKATRIVNTVLTAATNNNIFT